MERYGIQRCHIILSSQINSGIEKNLLHKAFHHINEKSEVIVQKINFSCNNKIIKEDYLTTPGVVSFVTSVTFITGKEINIIVNGKLNGLSGIVQGGEGIDWESEVFYFFFEEFVVWGVFGDFGPEGFGMIEVAKMTEFVYDYVIN